VLQKHLYHQYTVQEFDELTLYKSSELVLLPGFQKGRDIKAEQFWPKKGNLHRTRKNLKNLQNFTTFRVNKMFSHMF
jgi:hypothetical protein